MAMAIATEQQAGAELIHRGGDDRGLRREPRPAVIPKDSAAKPRHGYRTFRSRDEPQPICYLPQRPIGSLAQLLGDLLSTRVRFVDDDAAIHDEPNPARR